jgi:hypothetical protein
MKLSDESLLSVSNENVTVLKLLLKCTVVELPVACVLDMYVRVIGLVYISTCNRQSKASLRP